jgi:hypothetical protein
MARLPQVNFEDLDDAFPFGLAANITPGRVLGGRNRNVPNRPAAERVGG